MEYIQLLDLFKEQRRLNFWRLIRFGFDGLNSQMNGMCFLQSNIFHDHDAVIATHPSRLSLLHSVTFSHFSYFLFEIKFWAKLFNLNQFTLDTWGPKL